MHRGEVGKKDSKHFIITITQIKKTTPASTDSFTLRQSVAEVEAEEEAELGTNMAAPVGAPFLNHHPPPSVPSISTSQRQ